MKSGVLVEHNRLKTIMLNVTRFQWGFFGAEGIAGVYCDMQKHLWTTRTKEDSKHLEPGRAD